MAQRLDTYRLHPSPYMDVWSRTAPKYRRRATILLLLTAGLFAGLCCFAYWVRTGSYAPWIDDGYAHLMRESINPVGPNQITLVDFLLFPINVEEVPIQMVILGLLLASIASVPILVGILYRFPFSLIFVAMIAGLAAMPWYALMILIGCVLAAHPMFRLRFRYANAVLGLLPVVAYFAGATRTPASFYAVDTPYVFKVYAPWVLAVLGSCVICAMGLGVARLINYRPGGIAPVLALLFAVPVLLFHWKVGRDELEYRLLEHRYGPNSTSVFVNRDLRQTESAAAERAWKSALHATFDSLLGRRVREGAATAIKDLVEDRAEVLAACDEFMEYFPQSRNVVCVLYIQGRASDQRLNRVALERDFIVEYDSDVPSGQTETIWRKLANRFPQSEAAAVALNRLAVLDLRAGNIGAAAADLDRLLATFDERYATSQPSHVMPRSAIFGGSEASARLGINLEIQVQRARRLAGQIGLCRNERPTPFDPMRPDLGLLDGPKVHPLAALFALDPHDEHYAEGLRAIEIGYPDSAIETMVRVQLALLTATPQLRLEQLKRAERECKGSPGCAEILLREAEALRELSRFDEAVRLLDRLKSEYPKTCWAMEARERMTRLALFVPPA